MTVLNGPHPTTTKAEHFSPLPLEDPADPTRRKIASNTATGT